MKEGDFILMDFVGKVLNTGEIFDLTREDVAKDSKVHFEEKNYEPVLVIVGAKMVVSGIEKQLLAMKVGETKKFTVPYAEAFGRRDPRLIRVIPFNKFMEQNINPAPGVFVTIDNMTAKVQSVSGGRVRVDFNNPLAGKDLEYEITVVKQITENKEKADLLLENSGIEAETELKEDVFEIKTKTKLNPMIEKMTSETIKKWIKDVKNINFSVSDAKKQEIKETEGSKRSSH
ncbi:MAG: peptidylprolyl isomerase [Candidatus Aenigmatarchaeota archaeon]|nr:peptidylprolyl isomerase [Nanoarchaeota archaeon]